MTDTDNNQLDPDTCFPDQPPSTDPYTPEVRAQIDALHLRILAHGERIAARKARQRQQFAIARKRAS